MRFAERLAAFVSLKPAKGVLGELSHAAVTRAACRIGGLRFGAARSNNLGGADARRNKVGDALSNRDQVQQSPRRHGQRAAGIDFLGGED